MKKNNKKGFTIVELVIVIAVIAILTAVLIPTFTSATEKAKQSAALQNAKNALTAAQAEVLADGKVENETVYVKGDDVKTEDPEDASYWTFVFTNDPNTATITAPTGDAYTYTFSNGVITVND